MLILFSDCLMLKLDAKVSLRTLYTVGAWKAIALRYNFRSFSRRHVPITPFRRYVSRMAKKLRLHKGARTTLDDADYDHAKDFRWHKTTNGYVAGSVMEQGVRRRVYLHRWLLDAQPWVVRGPHRRQQAQQPPQQPASGRAGAACGRDRGSCRGRGCAGADAVLGECCQAISRERHEPHPDQPGAEKHRRRAVRLAHPTPRRQGEVRVYIDKGVPDYFEEVATVGKELGVFTHESDLLRFFQSGPEKPDTHRLRETYEDERFKGHPTSLLKTLVGALAACGLLDLPPHKANPGGGLYHHA